MAKQSIKMHNWQPAIILCGSVILLLSSCVSLYYIRLSLIAWLFIYSSEFHLVPVTPVIKLI